MRAPFATFCSLADFDDRVEVVEDQPTYYENAWKKARKVGNRFGIATLADDSGLEVEALHGAPGIYSARYGANDRERVDRLLRELHGVPRRRAHGPFQGIPCLLSPRPGQTFMFYGGLKGYIGFARRGEKGFGYDPVFMLPEAGKALSELSLEEKNRISHRGRALAAFRKFLGAER